MRAVQPLIDLPQPFQILTMDRRRGNIVSRETLLKQVWNMQGLVSSRTVDTHIARLRKKLGWMDKIETVYKIGYRLKKED